MGLNYLILGNCERKKVLSYLNHCYFGLYYSSQDEILIKTYYYTPDTAPGAQSFPSKSAGSLSENAYRTRNAILSTEY